MWMGVGDVCEVRKGGEERGQQRGVRARAAALIVSTNPRAMAARAVTGSRGDGSEVARE